MIKEWKKQLKDGRGNKMDATVKYSDKEVEEIVAAHCEKQMTSPNGMMWIASNKYGGIWCDLIKKESLETKEREVD